MAKKEVHPIKEGLREKNLIQKSTPLQSLWKSSLGLGEFKVLDTYLSRIDSHHPERRKVMFSKDEFEKLLGITEVKPKALQAYTDKLMQQVVSLDTPTRKQGFHRISLFSESECDQDDGGKWWVSLTCTPEAMKYIFNVEELGFLRYRLRNVLQISSRYSYVMFLYLLKRRPCKVIEVTLEELRDLLGCADDAYYDEFKKFNQRILKRCCDEINEKTELKYTYEPIRSGRKVKSIRFTISSAVPGYDELEECPKQISIDDLEEDLEPFDFENECFSLWFDAVERDNDFANEPAMKMIADALVIAVPTCKHKNDLPLERYGVLARCYHNLQVRERRQDLKPLKNRLSYLVKLIKEEAEND
jgi:hypothetical protein